MRNHTENTNNPTYSTAIDSYRSYDDGNIPEIDLPQDTQEFRQPKENRVVTSVPSEPAGHSCSNTDTSDKRWITEPLPESTRPRQDGPGGEGI